MLYELGFASVSSSVWIKNRSAKIFFQVKRMKNELKSFLIEENYGPKNQEIKNMYNFFKKQENWIEIFFK